MREVAKQRAQVGCSANSDCFAPISPALAHSLYSTPHEKVFEKLVDFFK